MTQPDQLRREGHLPGCSVLTWRQINEEMGEPAVPADDEWYDQGGIQQCVEGCPERAKTIEHAKQVAREKGWLTDEGFIWERSGESDEEHQG